MMPTDASTPFLSKEESNLYRVLDTAFRVLEFIGIFVGLLAYKGLHGGQAVNLRALAYFHISLSILTILKGAFFYSTMCEFLKWEETHHGTTTTAPASHTSFSDTPLRMPTCPEARVALIELSAYYLMIYLGIASVSMRLARQYERGAFIPAFGGALAMPLVGDPVSMPVAQQTDSRAGTAMAGVSNNRARHHPQPPVQGYRPYEGKAYKMGD